MNLKLIGNEKKPVAYIDEFSTAPLALIDYAVNQASFSKPKDLYPGVRADIPKSYLPELCDQVERLIAPAFGISLTSNTKISTCFAIVDQTPTRFCRFKKYRTSMHQYLTPSLLLTNFSKTHRLVGPASIATGKRVLNQSPLSGSKTIFQRLGHN